MDKEKRLRAIREIITREDISSQSELLEKLEFKKKLILTLYYFGDTG